MATAAIDRNKNSSAVFKMIFRIGMGLHGSSIPYLFANTTNYAPGKNQTIAEILTSYYVSFAATRDPNPLRKPNAVFWPSYLGNVEGSSTDGESVGFTVLDISDSSITLCIDPDVSAQCDFFSARGFEVRN
jgi:hypothetical protein